MTTRQSGPAASFTPMRPPGRAPRRRGPAEKPRDFKGTLRRLWHFFGGEKKMLLLIFAFVTADAAVLLAVPWLIGRGVDLMGGKGGGLRALAQVALTLLGVYLCDMLLTFFSNFLIAGASQRIVRGMRRALFGQLQLLPLAYYDTHAHGDLMSRFTNDIDNISSTVSQSTVSLMSDVVSIAGSFAVMLALNPLLTAVSLLTVPLVVLLSRTVARRTGRLFKEQQRALGRLNGQIEEGVSGLQVIKAFNRERAVTAAFSETNAELLRVGTQAQVLSGYMMPLMNIIGNIGFVLIAGVGGIMAVYRLITVGVIASFLSYSKQFSRPLNDVANLFNTLQTALAGAERFFEVMDASPEPPDAPGAQPLCDVRGEIAFEHVSFSYRADTPVLRDVNFHVSAGFTVALVGPTGAGKTTVASLLCRFYDVTQGRVLLDGQDIRTCTRASLRRCFGVVLQDTYLFSGTVRENIRYGRLEATDAEVEHAARQACADVFIRALPRGYDTQLSESGGSLSQGQRQLLAIARAILADPAVLVFDEATSNVDTRTERDVQRATARLMRGRTCFVIAHRLETIRGADQILVVEGGRIAETGTHGQLMARKGAYHRLYSSRFAQAETGARD